MKAAYFRRTHDLTENKDYITAINGHYLIKTGDESYIMHVPSMEELVHVKFDGTFFLITSKRMKGPNRTMVMSRSTEWLFTDHENFEALDPEVYTFMDLDAVLTLINKYLFAVV